MRRKLYGSSLERKWASSYHQPAIIASRTARAIIIDNQNIFNNRESDAERPKAWRHRSGKHVGTRRHRNHESQMTGRIAYVYQTEAEQFAQRLATAENRRATAGERVEEFRDLYDVVREAGIFHNESCPWR